MPAKRTMYLVDASGFIHRAFHAIRGLTNSRGMHTNALYGLANMLRKFSRDRKPEYCAVVFDAGRITFRNEMYADYKANRPPAPDELAVQFPYARPLVEAMGYPVLEMEGFEADDLIATLSAMALKGGYDVQVISSDKDLLQLVAEGVSVFDPMKNRTYDRDGVVEKMGVVPERVRDLLALMGDASDNVPGVSGIGIKGAADLINAFGPLEGIFENLDGLTPRKKQSLTEGREDAYLSRDLVTLKADVPLDRACDDFRTGSPRTAELVPLLTELEFGTLLEEMSPSEAVTVESQEVRAEEINDVRRLEALINDVKDREPSLVGAFGSRNPVRPDCRGLALALSSEQVLVIRPAEAPEDLLRTLSDWLGRTSACVANYKELHQLFAVRGVELPLPAMEPVLAGYLLHPDKESPTLESLALEWLKETLPLSDEFGAQALAARAAAVFRIRRDLRGQVNGEGMGDLLREVEIPVSRVLSRMELNGVKADRDALREMSVRFGRELQRLEGEIIREAGVPFNPQSPKQLADILFGKMGLPIIKKTKTGPSTNVSVLETLAAQRPDIRIPELILEFRGLAKLKSTYADALASLISEETGRVHTSFNQTVAATGRLSSSDPNLQNIPIRTEEGRRIRGAFVSREGHEFVSADYSQIELRVLAHLSGDPSLVQAFREGRDIHAWTSARLFHCSETDVTAEQRRAAKAINFGLLYGMGAFRLSGDMGLSRREAQQFIDDYFEAFPGVRQYLDGTIERAREEGYVQTLSGRRRPLEDLSSSNHNRRKAAERMATNTPIQGTAADIIKVAMVRLAERLADSELGARMVLQVHDELVLEVPDGHGDEVAGLLTDVMESAWELDVPLVVDVGRGKVWSDLH